MSRCLAGIPFEGIQLGWVFPPKTDQFREDRQRFGPQVVLDVLHLAVHRFGIQTDGFQEIRKYVVPGFHMLGHLAS
jgi:hypothetical protein